MRIRILFAVLASFVAFPIQQYSCGQDKANDNTPRIKYELSRKILNSTVRNGIGITDLNDDSLPDLIIGSNAHRFDSASKTINADPKANFRTDNPISGHYQVSIHLNESDKTAFSLSSPEMQMPITNSELIVPPG